MKNSAFAFVPEGGIWGGGGTQKRNTEQKKWQKPQYRSANRWNTETAFGKVKLYFFFQPKAASRHVVHNYFNF